MTEPKSPRIDERWRRDIESNRRAKEEEQRRQRDVRHQRLQEEARTHLGGSGEGSHAFAFKEEVLPLEPAPRSMRQPPRVLELDTRSPSRLRQERVELPTPPPSAVSVADPTSNGEPRSHNPGTKLDSATILEAKVVDQQAQNQKLQTEQVSTQHAIQQLYQHKVEAEKAHNWARLNEQEAEIERLKKIAHDYCVDLNAKIEELNALEQEIEDGKRRERDLQRQLDEARREQQYNIVKSNSADASATPTADRSAASSGWNEPCSTKSTSHRRCRSQKVLEWNVPKGQRHGQKGYLIQHVFRPTSCK